MSRLCTLLNNTIMFRIYTPRDITIMSRLGRCMAFCNERIAHVCLHEDRLFIGKKCLLIPVIGQPGKVSMSNSHGKMSIHHKISTQVLVIQYIYIISTDWLSNNAKTKGNKICDLCEWDTIDKNDVKMICIHSYLIEVYKLYSSSVNNSSNKLYRNIFIT